MTVYKYFLKTALRQKWIIIGYTAIFFILSIINGTSTGNDKIAFMEKNLYIGIVDNSGSSLSEELLDYLAKKNTLSPMEDNIEYIKEEIFLQAVHAVIVIPEDFESRVVNKEGAVEIFRDDRRMGPMQVENEINKFLVFANASYADDAFDLQAIRTALGQEVQVEVIQSNANTANNGANTWFKYYFNFTAYIIIAIYVAVIGYIMTDFNDKKIKDRSKISSKKFLNFNIEMYLGQVTIGVLVTAIFIGLSIVLKGKHIGEVNFLKYVINISVFSFSILCFTFLLNNITRSKFVINGISTVASLGTSFISGVFVEQEFLSESVLSIAKFFPTYYFIRINEMRVLAFADMQYEIFMQILFGIAFLAIGLYFSKIRQKS